MSNSTVLHFNDIVLVFKHISAIYYLKGAILLFVMTNITLIYLATLTTKVSKTS